MSTTEGEVTGHRNGKVTADASPDALVRQFLNQLAAGDLDAAVSLLAEDVDYINVSMPTIHGRERVRKVLGAAMGLSSAGFEVYFHSISAENGVVLTERTDVLTLGPWRAQFWVCGRFEVRAGEIVLWKDYFDWVNVTLAMLRGLVGAVIPALRAKPPLGV
jgi:limonene-1,2-epoxide hydrolase